jgi:crotonobetainyl-CoA:carnitine CoA-transferase CaiB-like acyl-CoA transferase
VTQQPLDDLFVLDLTDEVAGPYCSKLLADFGARVVTVEAPGGDRARLRRPYPGDKPDVEKSGLFLRLNTNKQSIVVDLDTASGVNIIGRLAAKANGVGESGAPRCFGRAS